MWRARDDWTRFRTSPRSGPPDRRSSAVAESGGRSWISLASRRSRQAAGAEVDDERVGRAGRRDGGEPGRQAIGGAGGPRPPQGVARGRRSTGDRDRPAGSTGRPTPAHRPPRSGRISASAPARTRMPGPRGRRRAGPRRRGSRRAVVAGADPRRRSRIRRARVGPGRPPGRRGLVGGCGVIHEKPSRPAGISGPRRTGRVPRAAPSRRGAASGPGRPGRGRPAPAGRPRGPASPPGP